MTAGSLEGGESRHCLAHDLVLPTLLFTALGGMTWAVRGCSGFGAVPGCTFAGVTWGAAWWYLAHDPGGTRKRRYSSGWIVLALTIGIGLSGARGWMQWPSFFDGRLQTNTEKGEFLPIDRSYGFLWLFIAGVPWAGLGACVLAWCGSRRETRFCQWALRIACGIGGALLARYLIGHFPRFFLPLYDQYEARYHDFAANPNLRRLVGDCTAAMMHLGCYLGWLAYEAARKERKNVVLILTVGLVNGLGWSLCQNWSWAHRIWPGASFNFWRCWESSGGLSIGIAYGLAYYLVNREMSADEQAELAARRPAAGPTFEWLLVYLGLAWVLGLIYRLYLVQWGNYAFTVIMAFGGLYYLVNRRSALKGAPEIPAGPTIAWSAVLLTAAMIAGLYCPTRHQPWYVGLSTGSPLVLGYLWYLARHSTFDEEARRTTPFGADPNLERFGLYLGLLTGLGLSIRNGAKGWCNIYLDHENYWDARLWDAFGPIALVLLVAIALWVLLRPADRTSPVARYPHAYGLIWLVLIVQNVIAQLITGPLTQWNEVAFSIYYVLLFLITAVIVFHDHAWRLATSRR